MPFLCFVLASLFNFLLCFWHWMEACSMWILDFYLRAVLLTIWIVLSVFFLSRASCVWIYLFNNQTFGCRTCTFNWIAAPPDEMNVFFSKICLFLLIYNWKANPLFICFYQRNGWMFRPVLWCHNCSMFCFLNIFSTICLSPLWLFVTVLSCLYMI